MFTWPVVSTKETSALAVDMFFESLDDAVMVRGEALKLLGSSLLKDRFAVGSSHVSDMYLLKMSRTANELETNDRLELQKQQVLLREMRFKKIMI